MVQVSIPHSFRKEYVCNILPLTLSRNREKCISTVHKLADTLSMLTSSRCFSMSSDTSRSCTAVPKRGLLRNAVGLALPCKWKVIAVRTPGAA
jgi:hypothetical protein